MPPRLSTLVPADRLPAQEARFVEAYVEHLDAERAAADAGYENTLTGRRLLGTTRVQNAVKALRERAGRVMKASPLIDALTYWDSIKSADPRELSRFERVCCRYCWGHDHRYQWRDHELREAAQEHRAQQLRLPEGQRREFDDSGGDGYTVNRDPCRGPDWVDRMRRNAELMCLPTPQVAFTADHSCPACDGDGLLHSYVADSRHLSPAAVRLFKGIKLGANGAVELLLHDQLYAATMISRHLGLLDRAKEPLREFAPESLSDDEMVRAILAAERYRTVEHAPQEAR